MRWRNAALWVWASAAAGCAALRPSPPLVTPHDSALVVPVFVDETETGEVGVLLARALQSEIYARAPHKLSLLFDEGTFAVDGTVLRLVETADGPGRIRLQLEVSARLVNRNRNLEIRLGRVSTSRVEPVDYLRKHAHARQDAVGHLAIAAARALLARIEERAPRATTTSGQKPATPRGHP